MILATSKLEELYKDGHITNLLEESAIKGSSIDLRISENVKVPNNTPLEIDLLDDDLEDKIETKMYQEQSLAKKDFWLLPGKYIFGNTYEQITIPNNMCGILLPRSTFARMGLLLPVSQYANPGYKGHLPIVIYNASKNKIKIPPYYRVMQLLLCTLDGTSKDYNTQLDHKYHDETTPTNPQSYKDIDLNTILDFNDFNQQ